MKIAYSGNFLREGLLDCGCTLLENPEAGDGADLTLLEFYGAFSDFDVEISSSAPTAAYFIDAPINEFWIKKLAPNFDHVFVDQPQTAESLNKLGLQATWLPLAAQKSYFQPARRKRHDVTFIGTLNRERVKRSNLLSLLQGKYAINVASGVSFAETQKIFSESRLVLNENLFPGLTLRVIQGMAAGAAVLTERSPYGHDFGLVDRQDILSYQSSDIFNVLDEALRNESHRADIAENGRLKCAALFSAQKIAGDLLQRVCAGKPGTRPASSLAASSPEKAWNETCAKFLFRQRFGGLLTDVHQRFAAFAHSDSGHSAEAHVALGDMKLWSGKFSEAESHYSKALEIDASAAALLKLCLLNIEQGDLKAAFELLQNRLGKFHEGASSKASQAGAEKADAAALLLAVARIYFQAGAKWEPGFQKSFRDPAPETAFECARLSWSRRPNAAALELMLECLKPYGMGGELLPFFQAGMKLGVLDKKMILMAADLAFQYYDHAAAAAILKSLKK